MGKIENGNYLIEKNNSFIERVTNKVKNLISNISKYFLFKKETAIDNFEKSLNESNAEKPRENDINNVFVSYGNDKINLNNLTLDQIIELNNIYKEQIEQLKKSNEKRKTKLLLYKKKMSNNI